MLPSPDDGRIVFLIPWGDRVLVGTTDTDHVGDLDRPSATGADIDYLLSVVNRNLPETYLTRRDVRSTYAGLRPLLLDGADAPSKVSREHQIFESRSGLITLTGGKLTTYRLMARQVVDRISRVRSTTHTIDLFAARPIDALSRRYGSEAKAIIDRAPLSGDHVWGEVDFALEREMAITLSDLLCRRIRLAVFGEDRGRSVALPVAERMAKRLGWDRQEIARQVDEFNRELDSSYVV